MAKEAGLTVSKFIEQRNRYGTKIHERHDALEQIKMLGDDESDVNDADRRRMFRLTAVRWFYTIAIETAINMNPLGLLAVTAAQTVQSIAKVGAGTFYALTGKMPLTPGGGPNNAVTKLLGGSYSSVPMTIVVRALFLSLAAMSGSDDDEFKLTQLTRLIQSLPVVGSVPASIFSQLAASAYYIFNGDIKDGFEAIMDGGDILLPGTTRGIVKEFNPFEGWDKD